MAAPIRQPIITGDQLVDGYLVRRRRTLLALCQYYSVVIVQEFRKRQAENEFWNNQTYTARDTVFSEVIDNGAHSIGLSLAHYVDYGVYLEFANNRQNQMIMPMMESIMPRLMADVKTIMAG
jgi:hypothetical protein